MPKRRNNKGKVKGGTESQPPSDEDYDTADNWSTASVLSDSHSSIGEEGAEGGPEETSAQENFEDKLKDCLDGVIQKSAQGRKTAIDGLCRALSKKCIFDFLQDRKLTVTEGLLKSLKKGKGEEQSSTARCLSLVCIQLGLEAEDVFKDIQTQLMVVMADNSAALKARAECAAALAICSFVACNDIEIIIKVLEALETVFKASFRKGDKSIPSHNPETCRLHASALSSWSLLLSIAPPFMVSKYVESHNSKLPDLLHSSDVDLRIAAGETIALMYELAREEDEEYEGDDIYTLCETLKNLATDSHKYRAKKDRRQQRSSFRDVLKAVEDGESPEICIKFGTESCYIDSWTRKRQYDAFCTALGSGINQHLQDNTVIRDIFDLGAPITVGNMKTSKASKWERTHYNAAAFKARTKSRAKNRDKRSVMVNGD